ncbi:glycoside hydrolase family 3 C-terminal domain-containing protein [Naasia sp. SYSU D00948]|uniref:glycoside hydrolase family 3 C-terminal domain-containing protein n=1 Tax=Naasia sp. SYSU D00948 TaxID=2817379 RepID=UPI001B3111D4|nr:glycoside hydrolase family 3 C-terminal domain-containing protein [Naasia sp. SYSU D00948]
MPDLTALTLEEKASLLSGASFWVTKPIDEAGIPAMTLTDGPHGVRLQSGDADHLGIHASVPATCFPPAVAVGSSWDPEVAEKVGAAVGAEARALGVTVLLGPGINIKRSPLCGRNFEYYSEDPLLSGVLGAAHVRGQQGAGVGASVKHFAANNQESDRMRVSADVDERTLREIYLPAFERVVTEARPATVMCSYNKINDVYSSENRWLLTDLLRGEWGFEGAVVSDWGAVSDRVAALAAGLDLEMPGTGGRTDQEIVEAVRSGQLPESVVDDAVRRVVALADHVPAEAGASDVDAHHELARTLATESAVLLKNDGAVLPLDGVQTIAVIGEFAENPRIQGGGSSHINATRTDAALDAMRALAEERGQRIEYAPGFAIDGSGDADQLRAAGVQVAGSADVTVIFAGLGEKEESEGFDRVTLDLPAAQVELIRAVAAVAPKTVVVLSNGGVVSLEGWHDEVDAILEGFLLGQAGGSAIADLLFGVANPSGHLAETIPLRLQDTPSYLNFPGEQGHVRYGEGVMVGYRHYETVDARVRYPFGHGLSYTSFVTSDLSVEVTGDDTATVTVTVTNTGTRAGKHVIQVYVASQAGPVRRPARELRAFRKLELEPGESCTATLQLDRRGFAYWDVELGGWIVAPGEYRIQVAKDAATVLAEQSVTLTGDVIVPVLSFASTVGEWFAHPIAGPALMQGMTAAMTEEQKEQAAEQQEQLRMVESMPMKQFMGFLGGAIPVEALEQLIEASKAAQTA